jgi:hypothetical protein
MLSETRSAIAPALPAPPVAPDRADCGLNGGREEARRRRRQNEAKARLLARTVDSVDRVAIGHYIGSGTQAENLRSL